MATFVNLTGQVFGQLTVVSRADRVGMNGSVYWKCLCICGDEVITRGDSLKGKGIRGCPKGCARPHISQSSLQNAVIRSYSQKAEERNLSFLLTPEHCVEMFNSNCYYCGSPPVNKMTWKGYGRRKSIKTEYNYNGIDRKDNTRGYEIDNVVPCCGPCNRFKLQTHHDDFLALCRRVAALHPEQSMQVAA